MAVETSPATEVMQKVNAYEMFQQQEGIPVVRGFAVGDLRTVDVQPWARRGVLGTYVNLDGTGGTNDAYVLEIPPGKATEPCHQLFEEMIYVLDGAGSTQIWYDDNKKVSFEWQKGSLFATPLNATHRHFNGRGDKPARFLAVTNAPVVMNLFHNVDFVFNTPYRFDDRFAGQDNYFSDEGKLYKGASGRIHVLETNFVPNTHDIGLYSWAARGAGGRNIMFELAHNTMAAHISEFPVGTYKKGHRHGPGAHVIILSGEGYSLLWPEGSDFKKVDWQTGSMVVPPNDWFHQHFNPGTEPARYLALRWGSQRYDLGGAIRMDTGGADVSVKQGGAQIEYEDESPRIHQIFEEEMAKAGAACRMKSMIPWCTAAE
jgi:oxalate decarboxylase/phosphoglucose isomerase-like protein (cupin superfamily)